MFLLMFFVLSNRDMDSFYTFFNIRLHSSHYTLGNWMTFCFNRCGIHTYVRYLGRDKTTQLIILTA